MNSSSNSDQKRLDSARRLAEHLAQVVDLPISLRLWDGRLVPLGRQVEPGYALAIESPGVLGSILRKPTLENVLRHYVRGGIDLIGDDLISIVERIRADRRKIRFKDFSKWFVLRNALPLLLAREETDPVKHRFGDGVEHRTSKEFIQFHYDVSNEFYSMFLDPEMQYSCAYFERWDASLEEAQRSKLEMICRKLRLEPDNRLLDIGCGWGGLVCYAAKNFGVTAHGVTLSQKQFDFAQEKIRSLGLEEKVTVELRDYLTLEGTYDKIASIGMYEHVGISNYPIYFRQIRRLLKDRGILLNHGITRRAKRDKNRFKRIRPEKKLILDYIFPGSELDHIGHTVEVLESYGFEVHDVEGWREHYALTCKSWCKRLTAREDEAIAEVGRERYRMWIAYLAGVSLAFHDGSLRIFQTVATKHKGKGASGMPPTRRDLYR